MSDAKKMLLYDIAVHQTKWLTESIWSGKFDPIKEHPLRNALNSVPHKPKALREFESKKGFQVLGRYLANLAPKKKKK